MKKEIERFKEKYPTTWAKMDTNMRVDLEFFFQQERERITDMLFKCYPPDMENFSTMTEDQAYRLLKCFWKNLNQ